MSKTCKDCEFYEKGDDLGRHTFDCTFHKESYLWITPCSRFKQKGTKMKETIKNNYLLAGKAIEDPDFKICITENKGGWIRFVDGKWEGYDSPEIKYAPNFNRYVWEEYKELPEQEETISREFNCPHCDKEIAVLRKEEVEK